MLAYVTVILQLVQFLFANWGQIDQFIKIAETLFTEPGSGASKSSYVVGRILALQGPVASLLQNAIALPFISGHIDQRVVALFPKPAIAAAAKA